MATNETPDPILRLLSQLPSAVPPAAADLRIRSRCHIVLEQRHVPQAHRLSWPALFSRAVNPALGITGSIYAAAAALEALRLTGWL
jgi:hypothetical protein